MIDKIVEKALTFKGVPYKKGGNGKEGIDCAGLLTKAFQSGGLNIPSCPEHQFKIGMPVELQNLKKGDLLFFEDKNNNPQVSAVGLVTKVSKDKESVLFVYANPKRGVEVSELQNPYWKQFSLTAVRPLGYVED
ncbi:C40 family peptidase [Eisenibacter elegans]|jgi:cell wall-associated NlpC family hydrolase|uniref:C40 family peptidase n=1 Tax=Eisenibacter elegans TaxID=997 RepID=UPI00047E6EC5|nr:NlpC/P60 family protein [Eisenibacter elegans]